MNTALESQDDISRKVSKFLTSLKEDVDNSHHLHSVGINTGLSSTIEGMITNPFSGMLAIHNTSLSNLKTIAGQVTNFFFSAKKDIIKKVFVEDSKNKLVYFLVLNEDNSANREIFFDFLSSYEDLGIQESVPVVIKFLPERVMAESGLTNELVLN
jgi:hypothetical protein